jgi:hypothetical protein
MNAAIATRETGSFGQYSVADVHPSVMARFFSHSTFGQNPLELKTSVKPTQLCAAALPLAATAISVAEAAMNDLMRMTISLATAEG